MSVSTRVAGETLPGHRTVMLPGVEASTVMVMVGLSVSYTWEVSMDALIGRAVRT